MIKRIFWVLIAVAMFLSANIFAVATNSDFSAAKGAVLIEAYSGRVLAEKDCNEQLLNASTTKIMTAIITLEQENLDEQFVVDPNAIKVEGSSMGLLEGDTVTLRTLAWGMLLASGNDAANAAAVKIAKTLARSEERRGGEGGGG